MIIKIIHSGIIVMKSLEAILLILSIQEENYCWIFILPV